MNTEYFAAIVAKNYEAFDRRLDHFEYRFDQIYERFSKMDVELQLIKSALANPVRIECASSFRR